MSPNKAFRQSRERFVHVSAPIIHHPAYDIQIQMRQVMAPEDIAQLGPMPPMDIVGPRTTFFRMKNQAKRLRRFVRGWKGVEPILRCTKKVTP